MSKLMQLYNFSFQEAMKLTEAQVNLLEDVARTNAIDMLNSSADFQKALSQRIAPVGRVIRAQLQDPGAPAAAPTDLIIGAPPTK